MDSVHVGDRDGVKGLFLINLVDEVTQYEFVGAVAGISERFLVPLLEGLLLSFPFRILGFHADNGSEYINHRVAELLDKLRVERFTKSRARTSNDNALVEGRNAHVVRRWFGHDHIPRRFAADVNPTARGRPSPRASCRRSSTSTGRACSPPSTATPPAVPPMYEADVATTFATYLNDAGLAPNQVSGPAFELVVAAWLGDLMRSSDAVENAHRNWLDESGFRAAVKDGHVELEAEM